MKFENKKRILAKKTAVIAGIVLFGLILPNITVAGIEDLVPTYQLGKQAIQLFKGGIEMTASAIGNAIVVSITQFIFNLFNWLVRAGAAFFNGMLNIGFQSHIDIVKAGWNVTRDLANMFFILFLIIIAFATILRLPKYGIKDLLPKVILIALLINFSLVICGAIIDFSNIAANFFIKDIKQNVGKGGISGTFVDSLNLLKTNITITDCEELSDKKPEGEEKSEREKCEEYTTSDINQGASNLMTFIVQITVGSVVLLIAAFTLFAGGILLLIRIVVVWFLVMLVPLAFICYIMPALRQNWQKWWKTFLQWCFFAPAYAFFVWLAIKVSLEAKTRDIASMSYPDFDPTTGPLSTIWTATPGSALIHYFFIIALLLGGLIAATKMGIYGADTAMNIVNKAKQGTVNWAKRTSMRPVKALGTMAGAGALTAGGKLFGGRIGRRMQARATQLRETAAERPEHKKYAALLKTMSDKDLTEETKKAFGIRKVIAAKAAMERGLLQKTDDRDAVRSAVKTFEGYGLLKEANELKRRRFSTLEGKDDKETKDLMTEAYKEGKARGYHKEYKPNMFKGKPGEMAIDVIVQTEATVSDAKKILDAIPTDTQEEVKQAIKRNFAKKINISDAAEMRRRGVYAAHTGDLITAFTDIGGLNEAALEKFAADMKPQDFGELDIKSISSVAKYANASTLADAGRYLTTNAKELFAIELEKRASKDIDFADKLKETLKKHPGWAAFFK